MDYNFETPFDNIESAQEYLALLSEALQDATQNVEADILGEANSQSSRRRDALRLVQYKLQKLEQHIKASRRLLNDLRTLRRLLLDRRAEVAAASPRIQEKAS
jgi:ABC-type transporter Mla subunit MlaD